MLQFHLYYHCYSIIFSIAFSVYPVVYGNWLALARVICAYCFPTLCLLIPHIGSLKLAFVGVYIPQKLSNAVN